LRRAFFVQVAREVPPDGLAARAAL